MDARAYWLLPLCYPFPDFRHRDCVPISMGVVVKQCGVAALVSVGFFLLVLILGLAYAWRKGALEWK